MQAAVDFVARCIAGQGLGVATQAQSTATQASNDLGGVKFVQLTDEEYNNLETKDAHTFYLVSKGETIILYLGNTTIGSGVAGGNTIIQTISAIAVAGNLTEVN
ncbi:MAG: hypothetical protein J6T10_21000 [Methanobrevibacter sp.]|nr:hypothetical protein [Methanobrevibacter sp.]